MAAKEWILNLAVNRWGLNKKNSVGPVSAWIRQCAPRHISDWEKFYKQKLAKFIDENRERLQQKGLPIDDPDEYLKALGQKLYVKISKVLRAEIEEVTENDCIQYIRNLVINRTFEGYQTEKETVYQQLQRQLDDLGVKIEPATDEQDRCYNVDFVIRIGSKMIGLQIKPETLEHAPEAYKWFEAQKQSHARFQKDYGGPVFMVISVVEKNGRKSIWDEENLILQIKKAIKELLEGG
ncbi:MAG: MjaI family restriction endonuclease [Planctomycetota bacterium]|nr:MAG: MjaI family restriction endonuclease [Planctomycetota bacterium]